MGNIGWQRKAEFRILAFMQILTVTMAAVRTVCHKTGYRDFILFLKIFPIFSNFGKKKMGLRKSMT